MKKLINAGLILTSLLGYMEWGQGQSSFIFEVEYGLLFGNMGGTDTFSHPLILIPLAGQLLLLITLFQKTPNRKLGTAGLICLSVIMLFLTLIGWMNMNMKMVLYTLPFIIVGIVFILYPMKDKVQRATK